MKRNSNYKFSLNNGFTIVCAVGLFVIALYIVVSSQNGEILDFKCQVRRQNTRTNRRHVKCLPTFGGWNKMQVKAPKNKFQAVNTTETLFIYSAYYERTRSWVRVIALTSSLEMKVICIMWYRNHHYNTRGYLVNVNENRDHSVTAGYVLCPVCGTRTPSAISLIPGSQLDAMHSNTSPYNPITQRAIVWDITYTLQNETSISRFLTSPENLLVVNDVSQGSDLRTLRYITACVSPIHGQNVGIQQFIEWIELNRMLGVDFFSVYVEDASDELINVLNYYQRTGVLEILTWYIPVCDIHYHGQLAAINDCLYRNKPYTKYLMTIDLDEYIIPQGKDNATLKDLISRLKDIADGNSHRNVYSFRHTRFFNDSGSQNSHGRVSGEGLITQTHVLQRKNIDELYRSKIIVNAVDITTLGIHTVWATYRDVEPYIIDPAIGLLHHYSGTYCPGTAVVTNTAAQKYGDQLIENVKTVLKEVNTNENGNQGA